MDGNDGPEKDSTLGHKKSFPKKGVNYWNLYSHNTHKTSQEVFDHVISINEIIAGNAEIQQNRLLREQMVGILNRRDTYGNTPLHYAKPYPDQNIVKLLLSLGAKLDVNTQGTIQHYNGIRYHLFHII